MVDTRYGGCISFKALFGKNDCFCQIDTAYIIATKTISPFCKVIANIFPKSSQKQFENIVTGDNF